MAGQIIAKPRFDSGGGGFLFPSQGQYQIKDSKGNIVEQGFAGGQMGENGVKVQSRFLASGQAGQGYSLNFNGQDYNFSGKPGQRFEFNEGSAEPTLVGDKGAYGSSSGGGGADGMPFGGVSGGGSSGTAALPFYLNGFPQYNPVNYNPVGFGEIDTAPYNFTDPTKFGQEFGQANAASIKENFGTSKDFAQQALDAELKGLKGFVPGAADLQRGEVAKDNASNQATRTKQVEGTLPNARGTFASLRNSLRGQGSRAETYASGRLPNSFADRALELGVRGRAADTASFGGFGSRSAQAKKTSDLMSAEERLQVAQYGEGLIGQNAQQQEGLVANEAQLFLAPTEYSNAGSQVKVTPEVGAGRLTYQGLSELDQSTLLSPAQALQSQTQQNQFATNLEQNTRQFNTEGNFRADTLNSQNQLATDQFNAANVFTSQLGQFNYNAGYLAQLQGANQANLNTALGVGVAGENAGTYSSGVETGQNANTITSVGQGIGAISGAVQGFANLFGNSVAPASTKTESTLGTPENGAVKVEGKPSAPLSTDASVPNSFKFPSGSTLPEGYTAVASNADGTVTAIKNSDHAAEHERFSEFAGEDVLAATVATASAAADRSLANSAALSFTPVPGFKKIGMTSSGQDIYSLPSVASDGNAQLGQDNLLNVAHMLASLGSTDTSMLSSINELAGHAGSPALQGTLDHLSDTAGANAVAKHLVKTVAGTVDPKTPAGAQVTAGAMRIGQAWGNLSPAQKSMAIMSLAGPVIEHKTGKTIGSEPVHGTDKAALGGLSAGQVMGFTQKGANGFSLARNWNDHAAIGELIGANGSKDRAAEISHALGLAGFGPQGSSIPISGEYLKRTGAAPAPEFGVGALAFASPRMVPKGYNVATTTPDGKVIAVPNTHKNTGTLGGSNSIAPLVYRKTRQIAGNSHPAQAMWKASPTQDVVRGSVGGSALVAGLDTMADKTPYLFSAVAAHSIFANMMGD